MAAPPTHRPRYSRTTPVDPDVDAPFLPWAELFAHLETTFKQGDHVAIIGPTGTGKTHMALEIAEIRDWVLVVACKPKDPLITDAVKRGYYRIPGNSLEIPYTDGKPVHNRVIYWPRLPDGAAGKVAKHNLLKAEKAIQQPLVGGALGYVRRQGNWCLVIDEGTWVCRDLKLQTDIDSALQNFRTLNASIIILGQRPAWMGKYVMSQPSHIFLFQTSQHDDLKSLGEISGVNNHIVRQVVAQLDHKTHECLYIGTRSRELYRTIAPPR
jgi:hypothetical protein